LSQQQGPVAVITGAGSGFGAALAARCQGAGYAIAVLDIDGDAAKRTAASLETAGGTAIAGAVDVADRRALDDAAAEVRSALGRCDLLFANVGVQQISTLEGFSDNDWQWLLSVNVKGTIDTVFSFLPLMRDTSGDRHVVFTASDSVLAPSPRIGPYIVSKAAVTAFADVLALELADEGIGVTTVFPSGMITNHLVSSEAARPAALGPWRLREEDMAVVSVNAAPTPADIASPEDAAANVLEQVLDNHRYVVTHGTSRARFQARVARLNEAYHRMERYDTKGGS